MQIVLEQKDLRIEDRSNLTIGYRVFKVRLFNWKYQHSNVIADDDDANTDEDDANSSGDK